MQDREFEQIFRSAAREAPPASFDVDDVTATSRRITARRRTATVSGSLVAAAVLALGVFLGPSLLQPPAQHGAQPPPATPQPPAVGPLSEPNARSGTGPQVPTGRNPVAPHSSTSCDSVDPRIASELAKELGTGDENSAQPVRNGDCPPDSVGAGIRMREGATDGTVSAVLSPASSVSPAQVVPGGFEHHGAKGYTVKAKSGKVLTVRSHPVRADLPAPRSDQLQLIAERIGGRL